MRKQIFKVEGYVGNPPSFRLEMRNALKELGQAYFGPAPVDGPKNFGCWLFGQPDTWKGVIGIQPYENGDVEVWYDSFRVSSEHLPQLRSAISDALDALLLADVVATIEVEPE